MMSADFNENLNINIYNMNTIPTITTPEKTLLSEYINTTHLVNRKVNGVMTKVPRLLRPLDVEGEFTKHFKNWNKQQLKNYRTTLYLPDDNKIYDYSDGKVYNKNLSKFRKKYKKDGQVFYKPGGKYDKRKFKQQGRTYLYEDSFANLPAGDTENGRIIQRFKQILNNFRGQEIFIVTGFDNQESKKFRGRVPQGVSGWFNNNKLERLIMTEQASDTQDNIMYDMNNIQGSLFDGGGGLKPRQDQGFIKIYPIQGFTSKKIFNQSFLDGKINHCVLDPMLEYSKEQLEKHTEKKTQKEINKFTRLTNKIIEYKKEYSDGVPQDKLQEVCNITGFNVQVFLPSSLFKNEKWLDFKGNKGMIRYSKNFKFINSRWNHLDLLHETSKVEALDDEAFDELHKRLIKDKEYFGYQEYHRVDTIITQHGKFNRKSDYKEQSVKFINENNLNWYRMNIKKDHPELTKFMDCAVMTNGTVDFINTDKYRYDISDDNLDEFGEEIYGENRIPINKKEVKRRVKEDGIYHIDMKKAYTNCECCDMFEGYLGKIWEFRQTDKIEAVGFYQIRNIKNITPLITKLGVLYEGNVYFSPELKYYEKLGITFDIICGCWGNTIGIDWGQEKDEKGELTGMFKKEIQPNGDKIAHYCKWFGIGQIISDKTTMKIDTDNKDWIENLYGVQGDKQVNIKYYKQGDKYTCCIDTPTRDQFHYKHICAAILSYQRILMIQQLTKFKNMNNIVRVCVDGIYYKNEEPELIEPFEHKKSYKFGNTALKFYRWDSVMYLDDGWVHKFKAPKSKPYSNKIEVHIGPGGCGKTHKALTDKGLNNVCYIAHSWKLCRAKGDEYDVETYPNQRITTNIEKEDTKSYVQETLERFNVLVIDEVSTMSAETQRKIIQYYGDECKLIFCGDISKTPGIVYQCPAFEEGKGEILGFTIKPEYQVIEHNKNRRCKDTPSGKALLELLNILRDLIDKGSYKFKVEDLITGFINKHNLSKVEDFDYNPQDLILNRTHKRCKYFDEKFKQKEKYKILEGFGIKSNIVYEKPDGKEYTIEEGHKQKKFLPGGFRIQHGYTIDSIQGETAKERLYIDTHSLTDLRHLYTAMSRAKELNQIHFII